MITASNETRERRAVARFWVRAATILGVIALLAVDAGLLRQNRKLKRALASTSDPGPSLVTGQVLPVAVAEDMNGEPTRLAYSGSQSGTVLFIFGPGCEACERTASEWKAIVDRSRGLYRFVAISVIPEASLVREFAVRHKLNDILVLSKIEPAARESYALGFIPQTVLVDRSGTVVRAWPGAIDHKRLEEIEASLDLTR